MGFGAYLVGQMPRPGVPKCGTAMDNVECPNYMRICHVVRVIYHVSHCRGVIWDSLGPRISDIQGLEVRREGDAVGLLEMVVHDADGAGFRVETPYGR